MVEKSITFSSSDPETNTSQTDSINENEDSKDNCEFYEGGYVKLFQREWGVRSNSFLNMSFGMALFGLVMSIVDIGSDIFAAVKYLTTKQSTYRTALVIGDLHRPETLCMHSELTTSTKSTNCYLFENFTFELKNVTYDTMLQCSTLTDGEPFEARFRCGEMRMDWAFTTLALVFLPGILAYFKLIQEEKKFQTSVHWIKKLLLLIGFPFLAIYGKGVRLLYHDTVEFAKIEHSITTSEVLAESTLQFLVQGYIILSIIPESIFDMTVVIVVFASSIVTLSYSLILNVKKSQSLDLPSAPAFRFASFVAVFYFLLLFVIGIFISLAEEDRLFFIPFLGAVLGIVLGIGLMRTGLYVCLREDSTDKLCWHHVLIMPLAFGFDTTEYFSALAGQSWHKMLLFVELIIFAAGIITLCSLL